MEIKNTSNLSITKSNFCIYGPSGSGKTYLCSTLNNVVLINAEGGELSLVGKNIDYVNVVGKNGSEKLANLKNIILELATSDYEHLYFDSLTEICSWFVEMAKTEYPDDKQTIKVWGFVLEKMTNFIRFCRDLNKNTYFVCLEKTDRDEIGRRFKLPDLSGSIAHRLPAYFDFVFNLRMIEESGEYKRVLMCIGDDSAIAKSRTTNLNKFEKADLTALINKVQGEKNVWFKCSGRT